MRDPLTLYVEICRLMVEERRRRLAAARRSRRGVMGELSDVAKRLGAARQRGRDLARSVNSALDEAEKYLGEAEPIAEVMAEGLRGDALAMVNDVRSFSNEIAALAGNPSKASADASKNSSAAAPPSGGGETKPPGGA